jgi:hypothetical protein
MTLKSPNRHQGETHLIAYYLLLLLLLLLLPFPPVKRERGVEKLKWMWFDGIWILGGLEVCKTLSDLLTAAVRRFHWDCLLWGLCSIFHMDHASLLYFLLG